MTEMQALPSETPVSVLQELVPFKGTTAKHELDPVEGAIHEGRYRITVADVAMGIGHTKREAKHAAAKNMLDKLIGNTDFNVMNSMSNSINDQLLSSLSCLLSPGDEDEIGSNPVSLLHELCVSRRWPLPTFQNEREEGPPHKPKFTIACVVFKFKDIEYDDRVPLASESTRRVSFKNHGPNHMSNKHLNRSFRHKNKRGKTRAALAIGEDVEMTIGCSFQNRGQNRFNGAYQIRGLARRGRGSMRRDSPNPGGRKLGESPYHFYKVTIPEGHKYEKDYILGLLQSYIKPLIFTPLGYKKENDSICFHLDDHNAAEQILQADKKITTPDNFTLEVYVRPVNPNVDIDGGLKALMKLAMRERYNIATKALDLSNFHNDPVILKENVFCPLNRTNVMQAAIQIVGESISDLLELKLSENKLVTVDGLRKLKSSTPNLKVLQVSNNKVRFLHQFDCIQGLPIKELELDGNPLCDKFRDKEAYIREVQKRFPKLLRLDGTDVPRAITFNVEEETLPKSQGRFLCAPAAADVIKPFLQHYYQLYDSESRGLLVDAYHENAQFSMSCSLHNGQISSMVPYTEYNRNLMVVINPEKRKRLLRKGKANIVAFLTSLPRTEHDLSSFVVDCSIFTPTIMMSVCGVFREVDQKKPMRSFQRSFVIVPVGTGFCIINELLHISHATSDQVKGAFKHAQPVAPPAAMPPAAVAGVSAAPVVPAIPDIATQQQMVSTLALQSGMNLQFSEKCLSDNNWEFERAVNVFTELQEQGKIPPEAFIK